MTKERLVAFFDAMLAIIMTILVIELEKPDELTWQAVLDLRLNIMSYALSFFLLGTMWINLHNEWHDVKYISKSAVWWTVVLLFFSSLCPYVTNIVSTNFNNSVAQVLYGIVIILITLVNMMLNNSLDKENNQDKKMKERIAYNRRVLLTDIIIKIIGLIIAMFIYPPAMMISVFITIILVFIENKRRNKILDL